MAPLLVKAIGEAILQLKESGLSILLVEQNLPFAIEIADYTHVLGKGEIVYSSTPDELWRERGSQDAVSRGSSSKMRSRQVSKMVEALLRLSG